MTLRSIVDSHNSICTSRSSLVGSFSILLRYELRLVRGLNNIVSSNYKCNFATRNPTLSKPTQWSPRSPSIEDSQAAIGRNSRQCVFCGDDGAKSTVCNLHRVTMVGFELSQVSKAPTIKTLPIVDSVSVNYHWYRCSSTRLSQRAP